MLNSHDGIRKIIEESMKAQADQRREYTLFGKWLYIKDRFAAQIDIMSVIEELERTMPWFLFDDVDEFLVGDFDFLNEKGLEALYKDGAIYITNALSNETDLVENIIHEASHSLESRYGAMIYGDGLLKGEFIAKRMSLQTRLEHEHYDIRRLDFGNIEYSSIFDNYMYKQIGYSSLTPLIIGIFPSPYAVTSLREYWGVGFEDYFVGDREYLQRTCPILFAKIEEIVSYED